MAEPGQDERTELRRQRLEIVEQIDDWLEVPMVVLGFVWLVLLVVDLIWGLSPIMNGINTVIWSIFILDFAVRFILAPDKVHYFRRNWLTTIALLLPALRVARLVRLLRLGRLARATGSIRLVRIVSSFNRGMRALRASMARHGFGYVMALSLIVVAVGAAGIFGFERGADGTNIDSYGDALWWTGLVLTTLGPPDFPTTVEGRLLTLLLAVYAFAIFGYVTATIASYLVGRDAQSAMAASGGGEAIESLRVEIAALREEIRRLASARNGEDDAGVERKQ
jgi:voltage-gated potassium channel